jgi:hypothetical protein
MLSGSELQRARRLDTQFESDVVGEAVICAVWLVPLSFGISPELVAIFGYCDGLKHHLVAANLLASQSPISTGGWVTKYVRQASGSGGVKLP